MQLVYMEKVIQALQEVSCPVISNPSFMSLLHQQARPEGALQSHAWQGKTISLAVRGKVPLLLCRFYAAYSSWPSCTNTAPLESALLCRATMPCLKAQRALAKPFACSVLHWHGGRASSSRFAHHLVYRSVWSSQVPQQVLGDKPVGSMRYVSQGMR